MYTICECYDYVCHIYIVYVCIVNIDKCVYGTFIYYTHVSVYIFQHHLLAQECKRILYYQGL